MNPETLPRRQRLAQVLSEHKIDGILVTSLPNIRYLSGFTGSNAMLLVSRDAADFYTDPRYTLQAATEVDCQVLIATGPLLPEAVKRIKRGRVRLLGFEPQHLTVSTFESLRGALPASTGLTSGAGMIEALRTIKSPAEIELIRRSALTNSRAFEAGVRRFKSGMKESELAAEFEYRMRRLGAEKPAFDTIVAGAERSALPHAQPTAAALTTGFVVIDMGAMREGYASDMTRMLHIGVPSPKAKRLYKAVLDAQLAAIAAVRAGIGTAYVDAQARKVLKAAGYEKYFIHSTGHGLGLEIHESPRIGRRDKGRLAAGMAITIEPGAYLEGFGGVRIEDTVVVTATGCEILTLTDKRLRVV